MEQSTVQIGFTPYTVAPQVEKLLEEHLGEGSKVLLSAAHQEQLMKFVPWVALAFLPVHFGVFSLLMGFSAFATLVGHFWWTSVWLPLAALVFDVIALPGLFGRTRKGWAFFVYGQVATAVSNLLGGSLFGLAVGVLVLWGAFQVKRHYT